MRPTARRSESQLPFALTRAVRSTIGASDFCDLAKRGSQRRAQAFARHLDDVQVGAAGRQLEERVDPTMDLLDLPRRSTTTAGGAKRSARVAAQRVRQIERRASRGEPGGSRSAGAGAARCVQRNGGRERAESLRRNSFQRLSSAREELLGAADALARTEQQEPARIQAVVEDREGGSAARSEQVDEEVPAGDQIHAREGRIVQHVLDGEHDGVAQLLLGAVVAVLLARRSARGARVPTSAAMPSG